MARKPENIMKDIRFMLGVWDLARQNHNTTYIIQGILERLGDEYTKATGDPSVRQKLDETIQNLSITQEVTV